MRTGNQPSDGYFDHASTKVKFTPLARLFPVRRRHKLERSLYDLSDNARRDVNTIGIPICRIRCLRVLIFKIFPLTALGGKILEIKTRTDSVRQIKYRFLQMKHLRQSSWSRVYRLEYGTSGVGDIGVAQLSDARLPCRLPKTGWNIGRASKILLAASKR